MRYLVKQKEMQRCDGNTIRHFGLPSMVLMERAALAVTEVLTDGSFCLDRVLVVCGSGNNGGDGFAVARLLHLMGIHVDVRFAGREESQTEETLLQRKICENYGVKIGKNQVPAEYTCIVDALLGIGLCREVTGAYRELIREINEAPGDVLAVDIPSGVSADTGKILGAAIQAKCTVCFAYEKLGELLYPGAACCGRLVCKDIGITEEGFLGDMPKIFSLEESDLYRLPARQAYSNKGTYGRALLIAGQRNMCGAACLAGEAAYRSGAGLVRICTEKCNRVILQQRLPEALLADWAQPQELSWATAIGIGPGLGTDEDKRTLLASVLCQASAPLVLDADALNLLAGHMELLQKCRMPVIITPHVGEMARLAGCSKEEVLADLPDFCKRFAGEHDVICVLKDTRTVISDGERICINRTGCDGMATGGSGDVLTGLLTGLLAQGMDPFWAASIAVWVHGKAGEMAAEEMGRHGMLAGDILRMIPAVLETTEKRRSI